jgi:hypothetical protein
MVIACFLDEFLIIDPEFYFDDSSSSLLFDDDIEQMIFIFAVKELEDRKNKPWQKSTIGHLCISHNHALGHDILMCDYYAEVPIYQPRLFPGDIRSIENCL